MKHRRALRDVVAEHDAVNRVVITNFVASGTHPTGRTIYVPDVDLDGVESWSAVDVSDDPDRPDMCVVVLDYGPVAAPAAQRRRQGRGRRPDAGPGFDDLGTNPTGRLSGRARSRARRRLNVDVGDTVGEMVAQRLGDRLRPEADGRRRVRCGTTILYEDE